jgi:hypothetical protein
MVCIAMIRKFVKKSQTAKELAQQATDKIRDENLNNVILNNSALSEKPRDIPLPYDVDYSNPNNGKSNKTNNVEDDKKHVMLQLIEKTDLSKRKFILNPQNVIMIGSDIDGNDITVHAKGVSPHQCEIFSVDNRIFIKNLGSQDRTLIKRKKESAIVDDKGVRLLSKDKIVIGNVTYEVSIINQ